jgi:hypothetical protein
MNIVGAMDVTVFTKKEKLTERLSILVTPSTSKLLKEVESAIGLDTPAFLRNLIQNALEELKAKSA